jgi:hypothetical protein
MLRTENTNAVVLKCLAVRLYRRLVPHHVIHRRRDYQRSFGGEADGRE